MSVRQFPAVCAVGSVIVVKVVGVLWPVRLHYQFRQWFYLEASVPEKRIIFEQKTLIRSPDRHGMSAAKVFPKHLSSCSIIYSLSS
ncbi:hypothetical protein RRG08_015473 [Elysia crispata]|uniref:Uncharacterized protein n=1 Tax=Elysia crispata TaxID=231223 RepID=A0AAE1A3L2_9GAST|nr:hypothetical protein RRG08_015473 [Elysia crispata]